MNSRSGEFYREEMFGRWVRQVPDSGFDVAVPDENGKPMESALALLDNALPVREKLVDEALQYIAAFCPPEANGLSSPSSLIELSVGVIRGKLGVYVCLNFEGDTYGLWSVGFVYLQSKAWVPSSFRREAW